jgi:hypothetical protein
MVKDPRPHKPGSPEPEEALDLLRALARSRGTPAPPPHPAPPPGDLGGDGKLDALRALAEKLDLQLRGAGAAQTSAPFADEPPLPLPPRPAMPPRERDGPGAADRMRHAADGMRREWDALVAALPDRRALVPRPRREHLVFVIAALAVLALAASRAFVGGGLPAQPPQPAEQPSVVMMPPTQVAPPAQQAPPQSQPQPQAPPTDLPAITKAMSDCDAAAAQDTASLYFLVLPLVQANPADHDWRAVALQTVGNAYVLLSANDALDGLRDKKLVLRPGRYTFSALDSGSGASYSWTSATGVSRLSRRDSGAVKALKLGFDFSEQQTGPQWTAEFKRDPGICYWVSVLVHD